MGKQSLIVGILNVTPDSFSDGGLYFSLEEAVARSEALLDAGAGVLDLGGESTRPGFVPVETEEEIRRLSPVVESLCEKRTDCILSIDTTKSAVAEACLERGAKIVNDVSGFLSDPLMAEVAAAFSAGVILMRNGREDEPGAGLLDRIRWSWDKSIKVALAGGVKEESIVLDPGVGFGTTRQEDLEILRNLKVLRDYGFPIMLGSSRKRITAQPNGLPLELRLEPTLTTTVAGVAAGVEMFRVHDVAENSRAVGLADLIYRGGSLDE
nr:dihydropteroate synthase [Pelagicoccus albus]